MENLARRNKWQSLFSLITSYLFLLKISMTSMSSAVDETSAVSHFHHPSPSDITLETKFLYCCEIQVCGAALGIPCSPPRSPGTALPVGRRVQICPQQFLSTHLLVLFVFFEKKYSIQVESDLGRIFHLLIFAYIGTWSSLKNAFFLNLPWFTWLHLDCLRYKMNAFGYRVYILCHLWAVRTFFYQCRCS